MSDLSTWPIPGIEHAADPIAYAREFMEDTFGHFDPVVFLVEFHDGGRLRCEWGPQPPHPAATQEERRLEAALDAHPCVERNAADPTIKDPHPMPLRTYVARVTWV